MMTVEWPMRLPSVANLREHWATKARRVKHQRGVTRLMLAAYRGPRGVPDCCTLVVTLTRVAPRRLDSDNLASAFKAVRDEVAAFHGIDDGSSRIRFEYLQAKGRPAVRISMAAKHVGVPAVLAMKAAP